MANISLPNLLAEASNDGYADLKIDALDRLYSVLNPSKLYELHDIKVHELTDCPDDGAKLHRIQFRDGVCGTFVTDSEHS